MVHIHCPLRYDGRYIVTMEILWSCSSKTQQLPLDYCCCWARESEGGVVTIGITDAAAVGGGNIKDCFVCCCHCVKMRYFKLCMVVISVKQWKGISVHWISNCRQRKTQLFTLIDFNLIQVFLWTHCLLLWSEIWHTVTVRSCTVVVPGLSTRILIMPKRSVNKNRVTFSRALFILFIEVCSKEWCRFENDICQALSWPPWVLKTFRCVIFS